MYKDGSSSSSAPHCSPFLAGREAFCAGVKVGDNPHDETTESHWQWTAGWIYEGMKRIKAKQKGC